MSVMICGLPNINDLYHVQVDCGITD